MTDPKEREYYGSDEVADMFLVHPATVRKWLSKKAIGGKKIGKKWLIPAANVEQIKRLIEKEAATPIRLPSRSQICLQRRARRDSIADTPAYPGEE